MELPCKFCCPLNIACVYRPPDSQIKDFCDALETSLARVDLRSCDVLVLGDFNATSPRWFSSDPLSDAGLCLSRLLFNSVFSSWCQFQHIYVQMARWDIALT